MPFVNIHIQHWHSTHSAIVSQRMTQLLSSLNLIKQHSFPFDKTRNIWHSLGPLAEMCISQKSIRIFCLLFTLVVNVISRHAKTTTNFNSQKCNKNDKLLRSLYAVSHEMFSSKLKLNNLLACLYLGESLSWCLHERGMRCAVCVPHGVLSKCFCLDHMFGEWVND